MNCAECGSEMKIEHRDHLYVESGLPNVVLHGLEFRMCAKCGEEERVVPKPAQLLGLIAEIVAAKPDPLTGAEIRYLRKHLGWSGVDFAKTMGVTAETVSRWENERERMGGIAERLLRLMALRQKPIEEYPNERLQELATGEPKPAHLEFTANSRGWRAAA